MQKFIYNYKTAAFISGVLTLIAEREINFMFGWFCFVPLFIILQKETAKECFKAGVIFCLTMAIPLFYWMIPGSMRFTGNNILYGLIVFFLSSFLFSLYFGVINYTASRLLIKNNRFSFLINAISIASIYVVGEAILSSVSTGMPWFGFHSGNALTGNLYAIQPASYFGIHGLSFTVVFINAIIASCIIEREWIRFSMPLILIMLYMGAGYLIQKKFDNLVSSQKAQPFKVAILCENIIPEVRWNDTTGNMLVGKLLELNSTAVTLKPQMILWSESAVPWTYRPNDDLVNELLTITAPAQVTHLLGINTDYYEDEVFNSVYSIQPDGSVAGRYDKRFLLSFIEEKFGGVIFPFFSSNGFFVKGGESMEPLRTPYGYAGVMICNESTVPWAASDMVRNGAEFLVNLSNDGWFRNTYLVRLHFYNVRLRAVETRKDIAINSNNGYSGMVDASGNIVMKEMGDNPSVKLVAVTPNSYRSLSVRMPLLLVYICTVFITVVAGSRFFKIKK